MPNIDKFRRGLVVKGALTVVGSASFSGPILVNTTQTFGAAVAVNATMTFSASPKLNVPLGFATGSAAYQPSGVLRINSGLTSATASTTALNSGALVILGCGILVGAPVASYNLVGELVVNTIAQAASGGYFTIGFAGLNAYAAPLDVPWFIVNPA